MTANERQVGGDHYKNGGEEHWDRVHRLGLDYFQGQITKYVERCWEKNGVEDLQKARHFLDKYIELNAGRRGKKETERLMVNIEVLPMLMGTLPEDEVKKHPHPHVREFGAEVVPTGWVGYVFEGSDAQGFLYTCENCRGKFYIAAHNNPNNAHRCEGTT